MVTRGKEWGKGIVKEFGIDMYMLLYLKWVTNKDLLYSTGTSTQCYVTAWMEGSLGKNGYMYICGWVPLLSTWNYHNIANQLWKVKVKVAQLCPTLCDPIDYTVHGLQARILEWVAFAFSKGSSQSRDRTQVFRIAGGFFTNWATREAHTIFSYTPI